MVIYCPECFKIEAKWVCCGGNDQYGHQCLSGLNHCYIQCPKCNKTFRLCGIYDTLSDYLEKEKEKNINLNTRIKQLEKEISEAKEEKEKNQTEFIENKIIMEKKIKELENDIRIKNEKKEDINYYREIKDKEIENLKIQYEKDLKIKELEYKIQLNDIKNEYENKLKMNQRNLEKEVDELKKEINTLNLNNILTKNNSNLEDKEIEIRCYSNDDNKFYYNTRIHLSEKFSCFIDTLITKHSFNANDYKFKYDGKQLDKNKSLIENGISDSFIVVMEKKKKENGI